MLNGRKSNNVCIKLVYIKRLLVAIEPAQATILNFVFVFPFFLVTIMTRKKVQPAFISFDSARKLTYKKMKKGMLKKIDEPSTLCGIEACAIVYSPRILRQRFGHPIGACRGCWKSS